MHFRGRERMSNWDGNVCVRGGRIVGFTPVGFDNPTHSIEQSSRNEVRWHSVVAGGGAGVILELERGDRGILEIRTRQKNANVKLDALGIGGRRYRAGGVDLALSVTRLPDVNKVREVTLDRQPKELHKGDNPIWIKLVQEDGHRAWSSPVYVVK